MALAPGPVAQSRRVLVVDDDPATRRLLATALGTSGYRVIDAADPPSALRRLDKAPVDAIILDLRMPVGSGLDVLERVRSEPRFTDLPILILTGATLTDEEEGRIQRCPAYLFYKAEGLDVLLNHLHHLFSPHE